MTNFGVWGAPVPTVLGHSGPNVARKSIPTLSTRMCNISSESDGQTFETELTG